MAFAEGGLSPWSPVATVVVNGAPLPCGKYPAWQRGDVEDVVPERLFPT